MGVSAKKDFHIESPLPPGSVSVRDRPVGRLIAELSRKGVMVDSVESDRIVRYDASGEVRKAHIPLQDTFFIFPGSRTKLAGYVLRDRERQLEVRVEEVEGRGEGRMYLDVMYAGPLADTSLVDHAMGILESYYLGHKKTDQEVRMLVEGTESRSEALSKAVFLEHKNVEDFVEILKERGIQVDYSSSKKLIQYFSAREGRVVEQSVPFAAIKEDLSDGVKLKGFILRDKEARLRIILTDYNRPEGEELLVEPLEWQALGVRAVVQYVEHKGSNKGREAVETVKTTLQEFYKQPDLE